ncbi:MAG: TIM barrel protein, partial [Bacteroidota bacterium]
QTAAELGIEYYRLGYYKFTEGLSIPESLHQTRKEVTELAKLNKKLGINGAYQNHSGRQVGAAIWDIHQILGKVKNDHLGCQYDIRHATVEGGESWTTGLRLIAPRINTIVLKDFRWEKVKGKWRVLNVPIGEGMVDFITYFKWLKKHQIKVPISLHCEYDLGGAEHGNRDIKVPQKVVFAAMKKDLQRIQELWASS